MIRLVSILFFLSIAFCIHVNAQSRINQQTFLPQNYSLQQSLDNSSGLNNEYPDPNKVLKRSLLIPGWGQVTNKQAWKVPIVYGLLGGLTYYSIHLHKQYHDYRAAFYNLNPQTPNDFKFGPTPNYISQNANLSSLKQNRNFYRNRRDLVYVFIGLSYALNAIDAYVFAHLRSFDVSDDLSLRAQLKPELWAAKGTNHAPLMTISVNF